MSNIAFLFLPLAFSSLPAVLPFVSPSSQVTIIDFLRGQFARVLGQIYASIDIAKFVRSKKLGLLRSNYSTQVLAGFWLERHQDYS